MGPPQDVTLICLEGIFFQRPTDVGRGRPQDVCRGCPLVLHRGPYEDVHRTPFEVWVSDITILKNKGSDYHCNIRLISKNGAINLMQNADLTEKSRTL